MIRLHIVSPLYINAHVENRSYVNVRGTFRCYQVLKNGYFMSDTPVGGWTSTLLDPYFYFAFLFLIPQTHTYTHTYIHVWQSCV